MDGQPPPRRRRDPARKRKILAAAADLVAERGYHAVGMSEIGAAAGIVGSGIYRHFDRKSAVLVALLDEVMDTLQHNASKIIASAPDDHAALSALVRDHIRVAVEDRRLLQVYHQEIHNLPEEDRRRLRRAQRHYIEDWVHVLGALRPDLADGELRLTVHAAIGAVQSVLFSTGGPPADRLTALLDSMAHACLGVPPSPLPDAATRSLEVNPE